LVKEGEGLVRREKKPPRSVLRCGEGHRGKQDCAAKRRGGKAPGWGAWAGSRGRFEFTRKRWEEENKSNVPQAARGTFQVDGGNGGSGGTVGVVVSVSWGSRKKKGGTHRNRTWGGVRGEGTCQGVGLCLLAGEKKGKNGR